MVARLQCFMLLVIGLFTFLAQSMQQPVKTDISMIQKSLAKIPFFDDPSHMIDRPLSFENHHGDYVIIQQANVLDQNKFGDLMGKNSCGYHSAKNIGALLGLIQGCKDASNYLIELQPAFELFSICNYGAWRNAIILQRKKNAMRDRCVQRLLKTPSNILPGENVNEIRNQYRLLLGRFFNEKIELVVRNHQSVEVTGQSLIDYITQAIIGNRFIGGTRPEYEAEQLYAAEIAFLRNPDNITRYVDLKTSFSITLYDILQAQNPSINMKTADFEGGELLEPDEIQLLFTLAKENKSSYFARCIGTTPIMVLPSTRSSAKNPADIKEHPLAIEATTKTLRQDIANHRQPVQKEVFAFVLGNADQSTGISDHWIAVMLECEKGIRRYTIADSLNSDRKLTGAAANLIEFLEGVSLMSIAPMNDPSRKSELFDESGPSSSRFIYDLKRLRNFNLQDPMGSQLLGQALLAFLRTVKEEKIFVQRDKANFFLVRSLFTSVLGRTDLPNYQAHNNLREIVEQYFTNSQATISLRDDERTVFDHLYTDLLSGKKPLAQVAKEALAAIGICQGAIPLQGQAALPGIYPAELAAAHQVSSYLLNGRYGAWADALTKLKLMLPSDKKLFYAVTPEDMPQQQGKSLSFLKFIVKTEQLYSELNKQILYIALMFLPYLNNKNIDASALVLAYNCCSEILANINVDWLRKELRNIYINVFSDTRDKKMIQTQVTALTLKIINNLNTIIQQLNNLSVANNRSKAGFPQNWNRSKYCDEVQHMIDDQILVKCRLLLRNAELERKREGAVRLLQDIELEDKEAKANRQFSQRIDQFVYVPEQYDDQDVDDALESQDALVRKIGDAITRGSTMGIIFSGPPGVGKSFLAQAIAQRLGIPCFFIQCQALLNEYKNCLEGGVNGLISAIHAKYCNAEDGKCLVVIDEIDARDDSANLHANKPDAPMKVGKNFCNIISRCNQPNMAIIGTTNDEDILADALLDRLSVKQFEPLTFAQRRRAFAQCLPNIGIRHPLTNIAPDCLIPINIDRFAMQSKDFSYRLIHRVITDAVNNALERNLASSQDLSFLEATKRGLEYKPKPITVILQDLELAIQQERNIVNKKAHEKRLSEAHVWLEKAFPYVFRATEIVAHEWLSYHNQQISEKKWYETYLVDPAQSIVRQAAVPLISAGLTAGGGYAVAAGVATGVAGVTAIAGAVHKLISNK